MDVELAKRLSVSLASALFASRSGDLLPLGRKPVVESSVRLLPCGIVS